MSEPGLAYNDMILYNVMTMSLTICIDTVYRYDRTIIIYIDSTDLDFYGVIILMY